MSLVEWGDSEERFGTATLPLSTEYVYEEKKRIMNKTRRSLLTVTFSGAGCSIKKVSERRDWRPLQQWTRGSNSTLCLADDYHHPAALMGRPVCDDPDRVPVMLLHDVPSEYLSGIEATVSDDPMLSSTVGAGKSPSTA